MKTLAMHETQSRLLTELEKGRGRDDIGFEQ